jgi:exonuclease V gamma subunit
LWIDHLAVCASGQLHDQDSSLLISRDHSSRFAALDPGDAASLIVDYINLYHEGLAYPLPVFPLASYAWASEYDADKAAKAASRAWYGDDYRGFPGDRDNPYVKLAMRGSMPEPFLSPEFEACAQRLYARALELVINT